MLNVHLIAISLMVLGPTLFACVTSPSSLGTYHYGKKINFFDGEIKELPDISIRFLAKRKESSPVFPPGLPSIDFEVAKGAEKKKISWSSGTGDIGPTLFEIGGERYVLELSASEAYEGFMREGEMVVWKRDDYEKMLKEKKR